MLRNYDDCNKIVINGNSGIENHIVKSGHQIVHAPTGADTRHRAGATTRLGYIYARDELESWKLEQAGSWELDTDEQAESCEI